MFEPGTVLYRYTIRNGKFYIHKGVVNQCINRKVVVFSNGGFKHNSVRCPRPEDIGVIRHIGFTLWLTERDDELAKQMFIDYEERQLNKLCSSVDTKRKIVKMLRELQV